jgi:adenylate cyclase
MHDFNWTATGEYLSRAVELNPNYVTGRIWNCFFLAITGKFDAALEQINYTLKLDPLNPLVPHTQNLILYFARRFDEAVTTAEKLIEREPHYVIAQLFQSSLLWLLGRADEAIESAARAVRIGGRSTYTLPWLAAAYAAGGDAPESRRILDEIESLSGGRHVSPCLLAMVYCNLADYEKALETLEKAWEIRDGRLVWIGVDPQFDALRDNPRFQDLMRRTNNPLAV